MESNSDLRADLNHLIQTCKDGQEGFLTAAENVEDDGMKRLFSAYSLERAKFVGELQSAAHELGDSNPEYASSASGAMHRGWINLKSAVVNGEAHAILLECARGECCAVAAYEKTLKLKLPANIREIIAHQHAAILMAHQRVSALYDASAPKWA